MKPRLMDGDPRHGTANGYHNLGCRCVECRAAWAKDVAQRKDRRVIAPDDPRHGRATTYGNYRCRCEPCTAAWARACALRPNVRMKRLVAAMRKLAS